MYAQLKLAESESLDLDLARHGCDGPIALAKRRYHLDLETNIK